MLLRIKIIAFLKNLISKRIIEFISFSFVLSTKVNHKVRFLRP